MDNRTEYKKICEFWQRRCINTGRELSDVLNGKFLELIYHNGKIENSAITLDDTREIYNTGGVKRFFKGFLLFFAHEKSRFSAGSDYKNRMRL